MAEFTVTMYQAEGISEAERRRRMHQVYQILLDAAAEIDGARADVKGKRIGDLIPAGLDGDLRIAVCCEHVIGNG